MDSIVELKVAGVSKEIKNSHYQDFKETNAQQNKSWNVLKEGSAVTSFILTLKMTAAATVFNY